MYADPHRHNIVDFILVSHNIDSGLWFEIFQTFKQLEGLPSWNSQPNYTELIYMLYYTWGSNTHREQANSPSDELYGIDQVQLSCMVNRWQHDMFGCTG